MNRMWGNERAVKERQGRDPGVRAVSTFSPDDEDASLPMSRTSTGDERYQLAYRDGPQVCGATPRLRIDDLTPQELGAEGERMAADYLEGRGWVIVERNWTCPYGEADLIAYDDEDCVFIEVKTRLVRSEREQVYPEMAVNEAKRRRYAKMAEYYQSLNGIQPIRFDIVAIIVVAHRTARLHHLVDAYGCEL